MITFLAVYRGRTIDSARLVGISVDRKLLKYVVTALLDEKSSRGDDPVVAELDSGRRRALNLIADSMNDDANGRIQ